MGYKTPREFFLDEKLYKVLRIDRVNDEILCWDFESRKRVVLSYSYVRDYHEKAYNIHEVSELLNRNAVYLRNLLWNKKIPAVEFRVIETNRLFGHRWSPKMIMDLWEYFAHQHKGRPRKDGKITPMRLPSKAELKAMLSHEVVLYYKDTNGEFKPTWKA